MAQENNDLKIMTHEEFLEIVISWKQRYPPPTAVDKGAVELTAAQQEAGQDLDRTRTMVRQFTQLGVDDAMDMDGSHSNKKLCELVPGEEFKDFVQTRRVKVLIQLSKRIAKRLEMEAASLRISNSKNCSRGSAGNLGDCEPGVGST